MISCHLMKLLSLESVMPSNHIILCRPFLLLSSVFPSVRVFSNMSAVCIKWPKSWSFSFSISPSSEYSGLISIRMDWLDLLARLYKEIKTKCGENHYIISNMDSILKVKAFLKSLAFTSLLLMVTLQDF